MPPKREILFHFFGIFIPGTEEIVADILLSQVPKAQIHHLGGGAAEFSAPVPYEKLNLFCFNNLFEMLYSSPADPSPKGLSGFLAGLTKAQIDWAAVRRKGGGKTFRVMTSVKNQLTSVPKGLKADLEQKIMTKTGLRVDRGLADQEFLVTVRTDGRGYFLKRLTRHKSYDKLLHKGELHPELAYMMCWLSAPDAGDLAVDPFCGYGAIPRQRANRFPFKKIYALDIDPGSLEYAEESLRGIDNLDMRPWDALKLSELLPAGSVDAIITDPPWGIYQQPPEELCGFYRRMLSQFCKVLRPNGTAVVLTGAKREFDKAVAESPGFREISRYDILVSGKKAALWSLRRVPEEA